MKRIPVAGPWITEKEIAYVAEAARTAWYENANTYQRRFEAAFATYLHRRYAIALPSCTSAIHLALLAIGLSPHDEVIVPDATWIATSAPISYLGATPVFADIDPQTWCLSATAFERAITPQTRAVIAVNLYGGMPDYERIVEIAERRRIIVIEDAAESIGSEYHGTRAGGFGLASVFSFHGSKTLTTGEGGMLLTDDEGLYQRCRILADHGRRPQDRAFWNAEIGQKYKMSSLQAALGLAQLERVDELVAKKREIFDWYRSALAPVKGVALNAEPPQTRNSYWMVSAVAEAWWGVTKERLMTTLSDDGIDTRPFFYPLSSLPAYADSPQAGMASRRNPVAYDIGERGINLPSALSLTRDQVEFVCERLMAALERRAAA
jgi:perosamine synthetase